MKKLHELTLPQRLAAGLGCVVVLALVAGAIVFIVFDVAARRRIGDELGQAPPGWADSLRLAGRAPDLTALSASRTVEGDGSFIAHDSTLRWSRGNVEDPYRAITSGHGSRADSALWRDIAADTGLQRFADAGRMSEWKALDRLVDRAPVDVKRNVMALPVPMYAPLRNAARGLVIRGLEKLRRGDREGARADLGAATSLGEQVFRREPSAIGSFMGKSIIASGARGWLRYADLAKDTALGRQAWTVFTWASAPPSQIAQLMIVAPDTALVLARDTTLALGVRTEALVNVMNAWMLRPRGFLFGPPRKYKRAIRDLAADRDPEFARIAEMTYATARRMHVMGLSKLLREARR